jgi:hypothetical protein
MATAPASTPLFAPKEQINVAEALASDPESLAIIMAMRAVRATSSTAMQAPRLLAQSATKASAFRF